MLNAVAPDQGIFFRPQSTGSDGAVTVGGRRIDYRAVAGTIVVHPKGWDDAAAQEKPDAAQAKQLGGKVIPDAEASMFYVAYFAKNVPAANRPIMFLYNGGPGSSTVWLHMGAFGPRRVLTSDHIHTPAASYRLVNNEFSLLDASDLVFIDAPGERASVASPAWTRKSRSTASTRTRTPSASSSWRFSRLNGGWNSPKYLFGESYGTPRSAVLVNELETSDSVDFNGVILLSQVLNLDLNVDGPELNPGTDEAYITALPTYAATAWYHGRLVGSRPVDLAEYLRDVEHSPRELRARAAAGLRR